MKRFLLMCFALMAIVTMSAQTEDLELKGTEPKDGAEYSITTTDGYVVFEFNRAVTVGKGWVISENETKTEITDMFGSMVLTYYWRCSIASQIETLMKSETIKTGEMFKVQLEGVKDATEPHKLYGEDGTITLSLKATRLPANFVSASKENGSAIKPLYKAGDAEGTIIFTFSEDVTCAGAKMEYGEVEGGTYGSKVVPFEVSGATVSANLQGINMAPKELNGAKEISLRLTTVKTLDGALINGNLPGSPGDVYLNLKIAKDETELPQGGFDCEDIDKVENLECWMSSADVLFDAVRFSFTLKGQPATVELPASQTTITPDTEVEGAIIIRTPMKNLTFDAGEVVVELVNARTKEEDVLEVKNNFTSKGRVAEKNICFGVNPAEGTIMVFPKTITFSFNDAIQFEEGEMIIGTDVMPLSRQVKANNNVLSIDFNGYYYGNIKLKLKVKDSKGNYITYGSEDNYITANYVIPVDTYNCIAITPEAGSKVESLEEFSLTFEDASDPTETMGNFDPNKKVYVENEKGEKVEGTIELGEEWTVAVVKLASKITEAGRYKLVIPEGTVYNSMFDDMQEDFGVSMGAKYNPEFIARYTIGEVTPATCDKITPEPGEYKELATEYTFTFSSNVEVTRAIMKNDFTERAGKEIMDLVTVKDKIVTINLAANDLVDCTFVGFTLEVKDLYGISITIGNAPGYINVEYTKPLVANTYACTAITPNEGEVDKLKEFVLEFTNPSDDRDYIGGFDTSKTIVLNDANGNKVAEGSIAAEGFVKTATVTLADEVIAAGTYTLIIPEGLVYNSSFDPEADDFGVSMGAIYNPEATFTYTVAPTGIESVISDMTGEVSVYSVQGILIRKADATVALKDLPRGIYIVNGKKVAVE